MAEPKFEKIAGRHMPGKAGSIFVALPNDGGGYVLGQVLQRRVEIGQVQGVWIAFYLGRHASADAAVAADVLTLFDVPYVTNNLGWMHGYFRTVGERPVPTLGKVGFRAIGGDVLDLAGEPIDGPAECDLIVRQRFSPYGAIARKIILGAGTGVASRDGMLGR
ncbi:MAG: hypothetical protein R2694_08235 [Ilumatobacteraceae bacterium]